MEHGGGLPPSALMFFCFVIVGVGFFVFTRFDKNDKKNKKP